MCSDPPKVNVKISFEVETWPTRTTDYNVCNDHQKISVTIDKGQNPGHFWKIKQYPSHNSEAWKKEHVRMNLDVVVVKFHLASNIPVRFYRAWIFQHFKAGQSGIYLDSLWLYRLCTRHTLEMGKSTVCICELLDNHGQSLVEGYHCHLVGNRELHFCSYPFWSRVCWLSVA
jgi:hypothetical protein